MQPQRSTLHYPLCHPLPLPNGKFEGSQPVVNHVPAPPIARAELRWPYESPYTATPALILGCGTYGYMPTLTNQPPKLLTGNINSSTQNIPSTIATALLQPLQDFSPPKENEDIVADNGIYSAAAKGKGKALHFSDNIPTELPFAELEGPLPEDQPSNEKWIEHTQPILQDYANRQIALPLCQRVNVSLNEPSQFIQGALQLLANRGHPQNTPIEPSGQLDPQLLENFTDVHRWATEYFRTRFSMPTVGSNVPVLLTIITNTFYEAHTQLIDSIVCAALDNMRARGAATLDIEDFAFGYDFKMSHDLPFAVKSSSRIHDTLERHRPRSPVNISINIPTTATTRSGRQIKISKQAQETMEAESEKQAQSCQRKKEKGKKKQASAPTRAMTPSSSTAGVVTHTPSATIYHTSNHGSLSNAEDVVVLPGKECPTCGRVMPPRVSTSPTDHHLVSKSQSTASTSASILRRATTRPAVSSNLRLAPVITQLSPSIVPQPTRLAPPPPPPLSTPPITHATAREALPVSSEATPRATAMPIPTSSMHILAGNVRSALALEATIGASTSNDIAQAQETPVRRGSRTTRARGARANRGGRGSRGRGGGRAAAPLITSASATTADLTKNASSKGTRINIVLSEPSGAGTANMADLVPTPTASTETRLGTEMEGIAHTGAVRSDHSAAIDGCYTHGSPKFDGRVIDAIPENVRSESLADGSGSMAYQPRYHSTEITGTANAPANISDPNGEISSEAKVSTAPGNACLPGYQPSTANTVTGPSGGTCGPVDFSDPEQLIVHVLSASDLTGVGAEVSGSAVCPAVTEADGEIRATLTSGSHVDIRRSKKRKLDESGLIGNLKSVF